MVRSVRTMAGQAPARHGKYPFALTVLCTILFLTFLDNTIVSVALGSVWTDLHASVSGLQWVVGAYALTFASAMLAFGMVGDEFGRKRVMLSGAAVFCAGSVLSALAPNVGVLIAGRAVMGLGAAASEPGTLSMLRQLYTDERVRARAVGVWTAVSALALAFGPVIGGILVGAWNWRAVFWFNLIFGLAALVAAVIVLPESSDPTAHRVDIGGTVLGAACLTALSFAIIDSETAGFASPVVIILFIVAIAAGAAFLWQERRVPHPLLDPRYLRVPRFLTANVTAFCAYFATFAVFFFSALYLAEVVGYSGYKIAAVYLPMTALMIVSALLTGRWMTRAEPRVWILTGCVLFGAGLLLTTVTLNGPNPAVAPLAVTLGLAGLGIGTTLVPVTSSALSAVPAERSGMAASATNTSREIGAVTGVAVLGSLVISQLLANLNASMVRLGIPPIFRSLAESIILTGRLSGGASNVGGEAIGEGKLVVEMENAAYNAFSDGLHDALYLSAGMVLAAGLFTFVLLGRASRAGRGNAAAYQTGTAGYAPGGPDNSGYAPGGPGCGPGGPGYGPGGPGYGPDNSGYAPGGSGYYPDNSGYAPGGPGYAPDSSGYAPDGSGYGPDSLGYAPGGSGYDPGSSGYAPGGPGYGPGAPG
jgi:EmrB/QacA subfamily drug resistance transporter